jgi:hypothetical protein
MKTKLIPLVALAFLTTTAFSQANKPQPGDLGLHYGVVFNGSFSQQLALSGWLKKGLEAGAGVSFSFNQINGNYSDSTDVTTSVNTIRGIRNMEVRNTTLSVALNPYLLYHFPTKNNLDIYTGGSLSVGLAPVLKDTRNTTLQATNYYQKEEITNKQPVGVNFGAGIILGCQFFFYKNLSLGAQGNLGFSSSVADGIVGSKRVVTNSGADNPSASEIDDNTTHAQTLRTNLSLAGNVGLTLNFYFSKKQKPA